MKHIFHQLHESASIESKEASTEQDINDTIIQQDDELKIDIENQNSEESKNETQLKNHIDHFINNEGLIDVILSNFLNYCKTTQSILHHVIDKVQVEEHCFVGRYDHTININIRLNFLTFLAAHSSYKIGYNELSAIYNMLIDQSQIGSDKETVIKWVKG